MRKVFRNKTGMFLCVFVAVAFTAGNAAVAQGQDAEAQPQKPVVRKDLLPAAENIIRKMDKNADGHIAADEYQGNPRLFERADENKDGLLDRDEIERAVGRYNERVRAGVPPPERTLEMMDKNRDGIISAEEFDGHPGIFKYVDANRDNVLDFDELEAACDRFQKRKQERPALPTPAEAIHRMDDNGDGEISADEFEGPEELFGILDADGNGVVTGKELDEAYEQFHPHGVIIRHRVFQQFDADKDGRITVEELPKIEDLFKRLDRDGDGALTREELVEVLTMKPVGAGPRAEEGSRAGLGSKTEAVGRVRKRAKAGADAPKGAKDPARKQHKRDRKKQRKMQGPDEE